VGCFLLFTDKRTSSFIIHLSACLVGRKRATQNI
jgi:hypothetical protein